MTDAREVIRGALDEGTGLAVDTDRVNVDAIHDALATAGLIATPEHDAAVRRAALEEAAAVCEGQAAAPGTEGEGEVWVLVRAARLIRALLAAAVLWLGAWHGSAPVQPGWPVVPLNAGRIAVWTT